MMYSKLFSSLVNSSLWSEPDHIRLLFITLLALADRDGIVYGSRNGLMRASMIDLDTAEEYDPWSALMSPDGDSSDLMRNPENEGRRIEEIPGGFRIINYTYYKGLRDSEDRKVQNREAQQRHREKLGRRKPLSATVSHRNPIESKSEIDKKEPPNPLKGDGFDSFWSEYPNKQAKLSAKRAWLKIKPDEREEVMRGLAAWKRSESWLKDDGQFIPHPSTFLNQRRFEDSPKQKALKKKVYYNHLPPAREVPDAEWKNVADIAKRESEKLRAKLRPAPNS